LTHAPDFTESCPSTKAFEVAERKSRAMNGAEIIAAPLTFMSLSTLTDSETFAFLMTCKLDPIPADSNVDNLLPNRVSPATDTREPNRLVAREDNPDPS
jgi:hypothetical protein